MSVEKEDVLSTFNCIISLCTILCDGDWGLFNNEISTSAEGEVNLCSRSEQVHLAHVTQKLQKYFKKCSQ